VWCSCISVNVVAPLHHHQRAGHAGASSRGAQRRPTRFTEPEGAPAIVPQYGVVMVLRGSPRETSCHPDAGAGMRAGCLFTYNAELIEAYSKICFPTVMTSVTQWHLMHLFRDTGFIDSFMADNCTNLEAQSIIVTDALTAMDIPFVQPQVLFCALNDLHRCA
jgi:hypothetical protein